VRLPLFSAPPAGRPPAHRSLLASSVAGRIAGTLLLVGRAKRPRPSGAPVEETGALKASQSRHQSKPVRKQRRPQKAQPERTVAPSAAQAKRRRRDSRNGHRFWPRRGRAPAADRRGLRLRRKRAGPNFTSHHIRPAPRDGEPCRWSRRTGASTGDPWRESKSVGTALPP